MDNAGDDDSQIPGTLLATSIKDTSETDMSDLSSNVNLHFTVPQLSTGANGNQETSRPIAKAELWLFPSFDTPSDGRVRWYELTLGFVFNLDGFNKDVETQVDVLWRDSDDCLMVDLTSATRRIAKKLRKKELNETLVIAKVTLHDKLELPNHSPSVEEWHHTCSYLNPRTSNTSFLVVKYISDEDDSSSNRRKRAAVTGERTNAGCCSLIEYKVQLQEVFGDWVVSPTGLVDVGACTGFCDDTVNRYDFSPRALLKGRLRTLTNTDSLTPGLNFEVLCAPLTFDPLILLIHVAATDSYVLMDYPVKVKSCGCR